MFDRKRLNDYYPKISILINPHELLVTVKKIAKKQKQ